MLNLDPEKLLMIGVLALIVLGPNRIPDAARTVGRVLGQFRKMSGSFQSELRDALAEPRQVLQHAVDEFGITEVRSSMTSVADNFRPSTVVDAFRPQAPAGTESASLAPPALPTAGATPPVPDDPSFN